MGVSIIRGAISSGKSDMCLKQISEIHKKNPDSKCIMIVPDHYSYETERKFVDFFGGIGLNNIEVLTLRRMSINFLSAKQQNHLTAPGKMMLIYKAVSAACEDAVAQLEAAGKDVLYDDTDERPGGKFATADLIGVPWQLTIGPKGLADGVVELKRRATGEKFTLPLDEAISRLIG